MLSSFQRSFSVTLMGLVRYDMPLTLATGESRRKSALPGLWQTGSIFPLRCGRAEEPVLKGRIYRKSSCEFSFFLFELEAGPKPTSNQAHHWSGSNAADQSHRQPWSTEEILADRDNDKETLSHRCTICQFLRSSFQESRNEEESGFVSEVQRSLRTFVSKVSLCSIEKEVVVVG